MSLLDLFAGRNDAPAARRARSKSRPGLESLESRQVLSTMKPAVLPMAAPTFGFTKAPVVAPVTAARPVASPTTSTAPLPVQTGTAFNMQWKCYYDNVTRQYNLNIQNAAGGIQVTLNRTKEAVFFSVKSWNGSQVVTNTVRGPSLPMNDTVNVRNFSKAGDNVLTKSTGLYWSLTTLPRSDVSYMSTPNGSIRLTYDYNSISNTGTLTVDNIRGNGRIIYSASRLNPNPGDGRPVDSPTANPIQSIDFVLQGGGDYNGGINVFHTGESDPTINVVVRNTGSGFYSISRGAW